MMKGNYPTESREGLLNWVTPQRTVVSDRNWPVIVPQPSQMATTPIERATDITSYLIF